jgi:hypothetical protein
MAWSTPLTAVSNATLTAAQWNASVRDNLLETAAAKATTPGRIFVSTGSNALAERAISGATNNTTGTTTSTSFTSTLTGGGTTPTVTLTTGTSALVWVNSRGSNATANEYAMAAFVVSGATTRAAAFEESVYLEDPGTTATMRAASCTYVTGLTAGSNTFAMQYRVSAGTGTYAYRHLVVMAL